MNRLLPLFLAALLCAGSAWAEEGKRARKVVFSPLRIETGVALRDNTNAAAALEIGSEVVRRGPIALDVNLTYIGDHLLLFFGLPRSYQALDARVDALYRLGPFISMGPAGGVSYRMYRQQWTPIAEIWTPIVGGRANATLFGSRTWGFSLTFTGLVDIGTTRMVLETAEVRTLSPFELRIGLRFLIGRGPRWTAEDAR